MAEAGISQLIESAKISKALKEKLLVFGRSKDKDLKSLEADLLKLKTDHDQKYYNLEKKFMETSRLQEEESNRSKKAHLINKQLENKLEDYEEKYKGLQEALDANMKEVDKLTRDMSSWEDQKLTFKHTIDKKDTEIKFVTEEWNNTSKRLREATDVKNEFQMKFDEINSTQANVQFRIKRLEAQNTYLNEQNGQINIELSRKTAQLSAEQRERASELSALKTKYEIGQAENKHLLEKMEDMQKNEQEHELKVANLQDRLTKATDDYHSMEKMLRSELQAKSRISELYSATAEDNEKKAAEFASAVEELQSIIKPLKDSNESFKLELEKEKLKVEEEHREVLKLNKELQTANDIIEATRKRSPTDEELAATHPTAALTSKYMKSGLTLTQVYSRMMELDEENVMMKLENQRLNQAMDDILKEIQEKTPSIMRQKHEYNQALLTIEKLTEQQNEAVVEFQRIRQEADAAVRKSEFLNRELDRYRQESNDQSKQIAHLVKEVEELHNGRRVQATRTRRSTANNNNSSLVVNDDGSCNDVSSSSEIINSSLVTFKDIAELQEQNRKLLAVVRTLSSEQESKEKETSDERTRQLQTDLDDAREELERLRHDRTRQIELVDGIVRQRDMYKVLLSQEQGVNTSALLVDPSSLPTTPLNSSTNKKKPDKSPVKSVVSSPGATLAIRRDFEAAKKTIKQQKDDFDHLKEEMTANYKIVESQLEETKEKLSNERVTCAKYEAQLHLANERHQSMKKNMENNKKECDVYRSRYEDSNKLNGRLEQEISTLRDEARSVQERLSLAKVKQQQAQRELDISNQNNVHLQAQNEKIRGELGNQRELLINYRKSQETLEEQQSVVRARLTSTLEFLQSERDSMSLRHKEEIKSYQERTQGAEKQSLDLQNMRKADVDNIGKLNRDLTASHARIDELEKLKNELQLKFNTIEAKLKQYTGESTSASNAEQESEITLARLQRDVRMKSDEISNLETVIEKVKQSVDYYKEAASVAEENLKKNSSENQTLLDRMQERFEANSCQITELEKKVTLLNEDNSKLMNEKFVAADEMERKSSEVRTQMSSLQAQVVEASKRAEEAVNEAERCRNELEVQEKRCDEANEKYQREVMNHAELMKEVVQMKDEYKKSLNSIKDHEARERSMKTEMEEKERGWEQVEAKLKKNNQTDQERIKDLEAQNNLLHENIQSVNTQLQQQQSNSRNRLASPTRTSPRRSSALIGHSPVSRDPTVEDASSNNEKLMEVIRYLRREKEISSTECELKKSELSRLEMRLDHEEKQHKASQQQYMQAQKIIEDNQKQLTKLKLMEREVKSHQAIQESNDSLRAERDSLTQDLRKANERVMGLENEKMPLQSKLRETQLAHNTLVVEKKVLKDEVERWKQRVQQMTSSPRRTDTEEHRRVVQERQQLVTKLETVNRELAEIKSENSMLKGKIRNLDMEIQNVKKSQESLQKEVNDKKAEMENNKRSMEEKNDKFIRVKQLARKFKSQWEEEKESNALKTAEVESLQAELGKKRDEVSKLEEEKNSAASSLASTSSKACVRREEVSTQTNTIEGTTTSADLVQKGPESSEASTSQQNTEENSTLRTSLEESEKNLQSSQKQIEQLEEKNKKLARFCNAYKQQVNKSRDLQNDSLNKVKELQMELKRLENEKESEVKTNTDLQNRLEEMQRQLSSGHQHHRVSNNSPTVVTAQPNPRKAVNVIGQQRVNQVPPYLRTARVIPDRPGPSAMPQVPSSSTQSTAVSASVQPSISTARVFPMSPAREQQPQQQQPQQQQVVSSGSQQPQSAVASSSSLQLQLPAATGITLTVPRPPTALSATASVSSAVAPAAASFGAAASTAASSSNVVAPAAPAGDVAVVSASASSDQHQQPPSAADSEHAIVSSSDDQQAVHDENRGVNQQQPSSSGSPMMLMMAGNNQQQQHQQGSGMLFEAGEAAVDSNVASTSGEQQHSSGVNVGASTSTQSGGDSFAFGQTRSGLKRSRADDEQQQQGGSSSGGGPFSAAASSSDAATVKTSPSSFPMAKRKRATSAQQSDVTDVTLLAQPSAAEEHNQEPTPASDELSDENVIEERQGSDAAMMGDDDDDEAAPGTSYRVTQEMNEQQMQEGEDGEQQDQSSFHQQQYQVEHQSADQTMTTTGPADGNDVIVLSSDSDDHDDEDNDDVEDDSYQPPGMMRGDEQMATSDDENRQQLSMEQQQQVVVGTQQQQQLANPSSLPADEDRPSTSSVTSLFQMRQPPLLLPPDITTTQRQQPPTMRVSFRPGPLTPGVAPSAPVATNEDGDGVVPYTPTLLPQRQQDESGYYPLTSPRVPPQQTNRFRFEDPAQPIAAVPAGEVMELVGSVAAVEASSVGRQITSSLPPVPTPASSSSQQQQATSASFMQQQHSTEMAGAVSSSSMQEVEDDDDEQNIEEEEGEIATTSAASPSSSGIAAVAGAGTGEPSTSTLTTDQQQQSAIKSIFKRNRGKLRLIGTRTRNNPPPGGAAGSSSSNSPSTSNQ